MASTKKVALSLKEKKQPAAATSSLPKKKTSVRKKTLKQSTVLKTKSSASGVSKLAIKNNTKKAVKAPKAAKRRTRKSASAMLSKLEQVEAFHSKAKVPQKEEKHAQPFAKIKPTAALALLSPYRFPISVDQIALNSARFGGVFFVVVGALFTLFYASHSLNIDPQIAAVSTAVTQNAAVTDQTSIVARPKISFDVDNPLALRNSAKIKITVEQALKVTLMAYYKTQNEELKIGNLTKISDDQWEINWDTTKFEDGKYKLKVLVTGRSGTYEGLDDMYVHIANTSINGDEIDAVDESIRPVLSITDSLPGKELKFEIEADGADKVQLYARTDTEEKTLLGFAYKVSNALWRFSWLPPKEPLEMHKVQALVHIGDKEYISNTVNIDVMDSRVATQTLAVQNASTSSGTITPDIEITLQDDEPYTGTVPVQINVEDASEVELFVLLQNSLVQKYVGRAEPIDTGVWQHRWNTAMVPNGEYKLIAYVKNAYGTYFEDTEYVSIKNEVAIAHTQQQQERVKVLTDIASADVEPGTQGQETSQGENGNGRTVELTVTRDDFEAATELFKEEINSELERLASALRMKDTDGVSAIKERIEGLKEKMIGSNSGDEAQLGERIDAFLEQQMTKVEEDVARVEQVISARTVEGSVVDTDQDGISDYDEVNIFVTDPFVADSDNDGFTDGAEILSGFDPLNAVSEAAIVYESPKETGIVREDILQVNSIITAAKNDDEEVSEPVAIISGTAMPNSFVTLYIFSTPVIVTIKTDADGGWNYRFDKELEDGEHEVYIGVTDNAGKLVAKSSPFAFVKEAQAFTAKDADAAQQVPVVPQEKSLVSSFMIYLVLSISVVAIGLVLILLGLHLDTRQRKIGVIRTDVAV